MRKMVILAVLLAMIFTVSGVSGQGSDSWTCLICGAENTGNYCEECGHIRGSWFCPDCQRVNTKNFCPVCGKAKSDDAGKEYGSEGQWIISTPVEPAAEQVRIGDIITLGRFEQDNNRNNGVEAIEWQVLAVENGRALLLSRYGLDTMLYNDVPETVKDTGSFKFYGWDWDGDGVVDVSFEPDESDDWDDAPEDVTWEECTLRKWLNKDFYQVAFTNQEQGRIREVANKNPENPDFPTGGEKDTLDRIFLLSIDEVYRYLSGSEALDCWATPFAVANGAYVANHNGPSYWWLRTPGYARYAAAIVGVSPDGSYVITHGYHVDTSCVVRPALWLEIP